MALQGQAAGNHAGDGSGSAFVLDPRATLSHIHLRVADLPRTLDFYRGILGFRVLHQSPDATVLGTAEGEPILRLSELRGGGRPSRERRAQLYHFALRFPERRQLATLYQHLLEKGGRVDIRGAADHFVSESIYIRDPDSNGIELTWDRPREVWEGTTLADLAVKNGPLDERGLLLEADPAGWRGVPPGSTIGHVHLYGSDLGASRRFYVEALGLNHTGTFQGMAAFAADGYHHHVGVNTWLGVRIPPASDDGPGLDHFAFRLPGKEELDRVIQHLRKLGIAVEEAEGDGRWSAWLRDPDNFRIQIYSGARSAED